MADDDTKRDPRNDEWFPPPPPAVDIPGALAATQAALDELTDYPRFERAAIALLQDIDPSIRFIGGSSDQARDGVGGPLRSVDGELIASVSVEADWAGKLTRELAQIASFGWKPRVVLAVTSRLTFPRGRARVQSSATKRGWSMKIFDQLWVAQRLLAPQHLDVREQLLGLPPPRPPVAVDRGQYAASVRVHGEAEVPLVGREVLCATVADALMRGGLIKVVGPGGIGKTRLVLEAAAAVQGRRMLFLDDRAAMDADLFASEVAGADRLILVVDNAHRRDDLRQVVGLAERRTGPLTLVLISRPGFDDHFAAAVDGARSWLPGAAQVFDVPPLSGAQIGELIRGAAPPLEFRGAIERVVATAEGNPQIALIGHRAAVAGIDARNLGRDELLAAYAASLVRSITERQATGQRHAVRELLAFISAVRTFDVSEPAVAEAARLMLELDERALERLLHDVADGGLLTCVRTSYAIKPDLLSEHLLWASFFADSPAVALPYARVWEALRPHVSGQLAKALGGLPAEALKPGSDVGRVIARTLTESARAQPRYALELARDLMPGGARIAELVVDAALEHLPDASRAREDVLLIASEVLDRDPVFEAGYSRMLKVAEALWSGSPSRESSKVMVERLNHVYARVPVDIGGDDGRILAMVQRALIDLVQDTWVTRHGRPGVALAIAAAARQMLTVTFESSYLSACNEREVVLRTSVLPVSPMTEAVLEAGVELFAATLADLPTRDALDQLEATWSLRRAERGRTCRGQTGVGEDLAALCRSTLEALRSGVRDAGATLSPLVRSAATEAFGTLWPDDVVVAEHRRIFGADWHEDAEPDWQVRQGAADARARGEADRLLAVADPPGVLRRWGAWLEEARAAQAAPYSSPHKTGLVLEAAAERSPEHVVDWLRFLADAHSPLLDAADGAFARAIKSDGALAHELAEHAFVGARLCAARGLLSADSTLSRGLLETLADDVDAGVRSAVARVYGHRRDAWSLTTALHACRPDDVYSLAAVLDLATAATTSDLDAPVMLADGEFASARATVLASARNDRPPARELAEALTRLRRGVPRLAMEWAWARVDWLASFHTSDVEAIMRAPEAFADELHEPFRAAAGDDDCSRALDLLEGDPSMLVRGAAQQLLAIVDVGSTVVTDRIGRWLASGDERLAYEARQVLADPLPCDAFTERARVLLASDENDIIDDLVDAREAVVIVGALSEHYRRLREQFVPWLQDGDLRLAAAGRRAVAKLDRAIAAAELREATDR